jgi:hypothetical protein
MLFRNRCKGSGEQVGVYRIVVGCVYNRAADAAAAWSAS